MMGDWGWGMGFGGIFMILFWVLIIVGIAALAKWLFSMPGSRAAGNRPLEILKERYARGEIPQEQYEKMRRELES
jgi:putative membrane protein